MKSMGKRVDVRWVVERLGTPEKVLEPCCGYGLWPGYIQLKDRNQCFSYIGLDIDGEMIRRNHILFDRLGLVCCDFFRYDIRHGMNILRDGWFDQVWLFGWWPSHAGIELIHDVFRVLKKDGLLFANMRSCDMYLFSGLEVLDSFCYPSSSGVLTMAMMRGIR